VQCEITQILGDIDDAHDIGPHDVLLMGLVTVCTRGAERCIPVNTPTESNTLHECTPNSPAMQTRRRGVLLAGPNAVTHDIVISALLTLLALDMFLQNFFQRTWVQLWHSWPGPVLCHLRASAAVLCPSIFLRFHAVGGQICPLGRAEPATS
jgi:hypothetical protein